VGYMGLPIAAMVALAVFVPSATDNEAGPGFQSQDEAQLSDQAPVASEPEAPDARVQAAQSTEPEPAVGAPEPAIETASNEVSEPTTAEVETVAEVEPKLPPRPQRLAVPIVEPEPKFVPSRPVENPPDPNIMAVVPDNPFSKSLPVVTAEAAPLIKPAKPGQTDEPAVASPQAVRPPPPTGPALLAYVREPLSPPSNVLPPKKPKSSAAPKISTDQARLAVAWSSEAKFEPPHRAADKTIVAAVLLIEPSVQEDGATLVGNAPASIEPPTVLAGFTPLEIDQRNSDLNVNPLVSQTAKRPKRNVPEPGEGPLSILTQEWRTALGLSLVETARGVEIAEIRGKALDGLRVGALVSSIDGRRIEDEWSLFDMVKTKCRASEGAPISLSLGVDEAPIPLENVKCVRRIALSNGLVFEAGKKRGKWRLTVVQAATFGSSDLAVGDQLIVDYGRNVKMSAPSEIANALKAARAAGAAEIEFGIVRKGAIENAVLGGL